MPFETLKAEKEPWLHRFFIPPPGSDAVLRPVHTIIFARSGQGKTALAQMGLRRGKGQRHFLLHWDWPALQQPTSFMLVSRLFQALEQGLFQGLLTHLQSHPQIENKLADWQRAYLTWLTTQMPPPPPWASLYPSWQRLSAASALAQSRKWESSFSDLTPEQRIPPLVYIFQTLGFEQVWVVIDNINDKDTDAQRSVTAFFQTLAFFELPLVYKIFLPASWEPFLARTAGPARSRVHIYHLHWTATTLEEMINLRLQSLGGANVTLDVLCQDPVWLHDFLARAGGQIPREWLRLLAPVVRAWQEIGLQPLPVQQIIEIWQRHPPTLHLDDTRGYLWIGGREIPYDALPERGLEMLRYLWRRAGQVVPVEDLYSTLYGVSKATGLALEARPIIDTLLWRVRKAVEPDPKHPVLLLRKRGQGVYLNIRW